jgi:predicted nuclease of predicted toxin-antitoxin system
MRFLIDECLHESLVGVAHAHGFQASNVNHLGLSGKPDWVLAERIIKDEFTFVTNNRVDFLQVFGSIELHAGLFIIAPNVVPALQRALFRGRDTGFRQEGFGECRNRGKLGWRRSQVCRIPITQGVIRYANQDRLARATSVFARRLLLDRVLKIVVRDRRERPQSSSRAARRCSADSPSLTLASTHKAITGDSDKPCRLSSQTPHAEQPLYLAADCHPPLRGPLPCPALWSRCGPAWRATRPQVSQQR